MKQFFSIFLLLLIAFFDLSCARSTKGSKTSRQLGVGPRPPDSSKQDPMEDGKAKINTPTSSPATSVKPPSLAPVQSPAQLPIQSPLQSPVQSFPTASTVVPTPTFAAVPSGTPIFSSPPTSTLTPKPSSIASIVPGNTQNDGAGEGDEEESTSVSRSLLSFDIILSGRAEDLVTDEAMMTLSLESFLYAQLDESWDILQKVELNPLVNLILLGDDPLRRRRLLEQQFSFKGDAIFFNTDGVPTTEEVQEAQQLALLEYAELQISLHGNGINLQIDSINFEDDEEELRGVVGTIQTSDNKNATVLTAAWATLLSAAIVTSVACIVVKRKHRELIQKDAFDAEDVHEYKFDESCVSDGTCKVEDYPSLPPQEPLTWDFLIQKSSQLLQQPQLPSVRAETTLMNVPTLDNKEVVELKSVPSPLPLFEIHQMGDYMIDIGDESHF